jgi:hemerythrin-like domain-containing protein
MSHANLIEFFTADHRACDATWASLENGEGADFPTFKAAMLHHFAMEEQVLFPLFEEATGMTAGPTAMMRMEHEQMRGVLEQMQAAFDAGDEETLLDHGDTLFMIIQQHNQKEEGMLYPMAQMHIPMEWSDLEGKLKEVE